MPDEMEMPQFDMSISTLQRINFQLWLCNSAKTEKNMENWWTALMNVYVELVPFLDDQEKEYHINKYKLSERAYAKYLHIERNQQIMSKYSNIININPSREAFDNFLTWEIEMRESLHKHGLLMKKETYDTEEDY
jgi:hypothetical protein